MRADGVGDGVGSMHGCSPLGQGAAGPVIEQSIGCSLGRRQAALVVEDDEHVLELLEVRRRLEEGGLDDAVRVAPDVDDLADQEALRVRRADAAGELDARP